MRGLLRLATFGTTVVATIAVAASTVLAAVGDGTADDVAHDSPSDAISVIKDFGLENAPTVVAIIGAIFLVAFTFMLIKRGLRRGAQAMGV